MRLRILRCRKYGTEVFHCKRYLDRQENFGGLTCFMIIRSVCLPSIKISQHTDPFFKKKIDRWFQGRGRQEVIGAMIPAVEPLDYREPKEN